MMGVEPGTFWSQMQSAVDARDVNEGMIKSVAFGAACSLLAVYEGYHASRPPKGWGWPPRAPS
jgi:phospholipid/cholesterol/gamma-HCH transport system permease protein